MSAFDLPSFIAAVQKNLGIWVPLAIVILSSLATGLSNYPQAAGIVARIRTVIGWFSILQHYDSPGTLKLPLSGVARPLAKAAVIFALLLAGQARAQYLSTGASIPMLEFMPNKPQPVSFAPGVGVEANLGFFQESLWGSQWDLLDLSAQLFGNYPGALQVAALVGTFNNVVAFGVAVPLSAADGSGAFQGHFNAYPVLSLSIPIAFGPFSPPVGVEHGSAGLRRGATLYLPF